MYRRGNRIIACWRDEHARRQTRSVSISRAGGVEAAKRMAEAIESRGRLIAYEGRKGLASAAASELARRSRRPLSEVIAEHEDWMRRHSRSRGHIAERRRVLDHALGDVPVPSAVTDVHIRRWLSRGQDAGDWSPRTFNAYRRHLFAFCSWAVRHHYLAENPVVMIESIREIAPRRLVRTFAREEACRLMAHPVRGEFYSLMFVTGLRWSEVTRLRVRDWFAEPGVIVMPATSTKTGVEQLLPRPPSRLLDRFEGAAPGQQVVRDVPRLATFVADLAACGIERTTDAGGLARKSTRKSFGTWLTALEVAPGVANMLLRHTRDIRERNYVERRQMLEPMRAAQARLVSWLAGEVAS